MLRLEVGNRKFQKAMESRNLETTDLSVVLVFLVFFSPFGSSHQVHFLDIFRHSLDSA